MSHTYIVTGANRGIGLALTQKILEKGDNVVAVCRDKDKTNQLRNNHIKIKIKIDTSNVIVVKKYFFANKALAMAVKKATKRPWSFAELSFSICLNVLLSILIMPKILVRKIITFVYNLI